jgi:hypothetical protein
MDKIEELEMITKRLMRRAGKHSSAMITPYPISAAMFGDKVEGPILRYMFPCAGTVTKGMVKLGNKPKNPVTVKIKMFNDTNSVSKGFSIEKKSLTIEPDISVVAGDCLEVSLVAEEETVTEIWMAFLWKPTTKDVEVKTFLIEDLENDLQEREKTLTAK